MKLICMLEEHVVIEDFLNVHQILKNSVVENHFVRIHAILMDYA